MGLEQRSVTVAGIDRQAHIIGGRWWVEPGETDPLPYDYRATFYGPDGSIYEATMNDTPLTRLTPFYPPDIRLIPLGKLMLHEDCDPRNFQKVRTTSHWDDKPLFAGDWNGNAVLLDGATRHGSLLEVYGQDILVPVQIVYPSQLQLHTWLGEEDLLDIEQVFNDYVLHGRRVKPRQTRFGAEVAGNMVVSVAETQPTIKFLGSFLPPIPLFQ